MRKYLTVIFLLSSYLLPTAGSAQGVYSPNRADAFLGDVYLGVKYGRLTYADEVPDYDDGADIRNLGFTFGKKFNPVMAMEFEFTYTVTEDDTVQGSLSTDSIGLFVVAKTPGKVYAKGRMGYVRLTQERNFSGASFDSNAYGIALGGGIGFTVYDKGSVELEYTILPDTDNSGFVGAPVEIEGDFFSVNYVWGFN